MKFSKKLQHYVNQQYSQHYLSYKDLKKAIKLITGSDTSSYTINEVTNNFGNIKALAGSIYRPAESRFMDLLNHELDKINSFSNIMYTDIKDSLKQIQGCVEKIQTDLMLKKDVLNVTNTDDQEKTFGTKKSKEILEDMISPLVEQLDKKSNEIVFLESYQQLNYIGFRKITKKYDKMNKSSSSSWYITRLAREPFMNMNLDLLLISLSSCYFSIEELRNRFKKTNRNELIEDDEQVKSKAYFEMHAKHLILPEDIMKVKVLVSKIVPLISIGLLKTEDIERWTPSSPQSNILTQKVSNSKQSSITLQTTTISYLYFDNEEFSEYYRIRSIREKLSFSSSQNSVNDENFSQKCQPYSDEKLVPRKYLDYTFRLRWYGENEGSPDQWLNLDWIHPMEPCCSIVEWFDPKIINNQTNFELKSHNFKSNINENTKSLTSSKTLLIQQKDVYHILKTFGNLRRESKNPILINKFDLSTYLNETRRNLTQDQILLLNCFIDFIQNRKLSPFTHLWFYRTTFANQNRSVCIHIDNNWKIMPEINIDLLKDENSNSHIDQDRKINSMFNDNAVANNEIGISNMYSMRPSIMYNTFIVSPQTEVLVSENMKIVSHGIMSVSIFSEYMTNNENLYNPRDLLKDVFGLASVSEVIGFSNIETCTALLFSKKLREVPHWFNFMAMESDSQQDNNITKDTNPDNQIINNYNRSISLNKEALNKFQLNDVEKSLGNGIVMPKVDVLHTGKNARILHDQEVTAQREANLLNNEYQTNSVASFDSNRTHENISAQFKKKFDFKLNYAHSLETSLLRNNQPIETSQTTGIVHKFFNFFKNVLKLDKPLQRNNERKQKASVSSSVRVEPKTFFANERTLLQWMNMSVLLATISISLLSFGTQISHLCGMIMAPVAIFFIAYSYYIYIKRNKALENKEPISYNDRFGPTLLVLCLIVSLTSVLLVNIIVGDNKNHTTTDAYQHPKIFLNNENLNFNNEDFANRTILYKNFSESLLNKSEHLSKLKGSLVHA